MRVAIRVDASAAMGTGHLRRCIALGQAMRDQGAKVTFLVRPIDAVASQVLGQTDFAVAWLPAPAGSYSPVSTHCLTPHHAWARVTWQQDASESCNAMIAAPPDWLVVDHYSFDDRWHDVMRHGLRCRVLVIDDIGDRPLSADVLLDHNLSTDHRAKYKCRLTTDPVWLVGPRFALLSEAYRTAPKYQFHAKVRSLGIFMGGTDPGGITAKVLNYVRVDAGFERLIEVVSTSANPNLVALRAACAASPETALTLDESDLSAFFARHDLHVGAGGGAAWERCCIGVPTIALVVADNQAASVPELHRLGVVHGARLPGVPITALAGDVPTLAEVFSGLYERAAARQRMSEASRLLVDGRGAQRAALRLTGEIMQLRPATAADAKMLHSWRNDPAVRDFSTNPESIGYTHHVIWMNGVLAAKDRWLLVGQVGNLPVGSIRFDCIGDGLLEVSLYLDPDLLGLGLGRQLLLRGTKRMARTLCVDFSVVAQVNPGNHSSRRLFESCDFVGGPTRYIKYCPCDTPCARHE